MHGVNCFDGYSMISKQYYILEAYYRWMIDNGWTPYLLVSAQTEGVSLPHSHQQEERVVLNISQSAVQNLEIHPSGLNMDAWFSGKKFSVQLPMHSILAIYEKKNGFGVDFSDASISERVLSSVDEDASSDSASMKDFADFLFAAVLDIRRIRPLAQSTKPSSLTTDCDYRKPHLTLIEDEDDSQDDGTS